MYKLVGSPKSRAFRVLWMLEELGQEYEIVPAGPRSQEILSVNPGGKVPALVVDDGVIIDSVAIIQFLADRHEQFTYEAGTLERAKQDSFLHFAVDDMDGICWTASKHAFVFPEEKRVPEVVPVCRWDWEQSMETLDARFSKGPWLMGETFTVPDIVMGHMAGWANNIGFGWPEGKITQYFQRVRNRPAFLKAWEIRENY